jgi:hypothetical protein
VESDRVLNAIADLKAELLGRMDEQKTELLARMDEQKAELLGRIDTQKSELIDHMHGVGAGLHTQIEDLDRRVGERFDHIEKRLDLQGGLVQSGARALARFTEWSEGTDLDLSRYDRRITEIEKRLTNLEKSA